MVPDHITIHRKIRLSGKLGYLLDRHVEVRYYSFKINQTGNTMLKLIKFFFLFCVLCLAIGAVSGGSVSDNSPNTNVQNCRAIVVSKVSAIIRNRLKVPSSFKHRRTNIIAPEGPNTYTWIMKYEAQNSYGARLSRVAVGTVSPANCDIVISALEI